MNLRMLESLVFGSVIINDCSGRKRQQLNRASRSELEVGPAHKTLGAIHPELKRSQNAIDHRHYYRWIPAKQPLGPELKPGRIENLILCLTCTLSMLLCLQ